ncbi:hypothetical protein Mgra_00002507 [Meloidogyne graminicola]|uniref:Uncharacterized protein n=1 Tax=Meloidogyne graminicola TaxID=189291 RepID=A0A8S9ZYR4_9BILA|nr:hypothetical protein Mgra_00002507 [Meloidogyne graminicola]
MKYIVNLSKYSQLLIQFYENFFYCIKIDNAFHCMDLENNKCQEAMCNCDRKVAECWTALSNVPNVTICLSCYMDDARQFANEPIKSLLAVRNLLNEQIDKTDQMIMRGGNNDELILRMELAIISLKKSHKLIDKIDLQFSKLFNDTQDKAKEYVKTAEELHSQKRTTEAEKYSQFAIYKNNVINLALGEYLKDRKLTFDIIEKLHLYIHNLEKLLPLGDSYFKRLIFEKQETRLIFSRKIQIN